jgi:hypothetical protein
MNEGATNTGVVDLVNHPQHYTKGGLECIDVMQAVFGTKAVITFCKLNAFKYLWRAGQKGGKTEDLRKARWYIDKILDLNEHEQSC